jgi:hypothetical protein
MKDSINDSINDSHPYSRPGWVVVVGAIAVVIGVLAIMMFNKM